MMKFATGQVVATPAALAALAATGQSAATFITRHLAGDWGDVSKEDARENDLAVKQGYRILSAYTLNDGEKIWLITEADRSSTCVLLPSDY